MIYFYWVEITIGYVNREFSKEIGFKGGLKCKKLVYN